MGATDEDGLYLAGHPAPPGRYRRLGAADAGVVVLAASDLLPASLDGRVAAYERLPGTPGWEWPRLRRRRVLGGGRRTPADRPGSA